MKIHRLWARKISYDTTKKRDRNKIKYIVIHYTGNKNDTAENNAKYFATSNTREAGAHFFVDSKGIVYQSVPMNRTAWSVGGIFTKSNGASKYYGKCTNYNSVSIELCNCVDKYTAKQVTSVKQLIKYINKKCPNVKKIIRHWDVNGKSCPLPMIGTDNEMWKEFLTKIK